MIFHLDLDQILQQLMDLETNLAKSTLTTKNDKIKLVKQWRAELTLTRGSIASQARINKKSLWSWLASFTGIFNTFQIHQVKGTVNNIKGASHKLVTEVDIVQQHLLTTDKNINTLKDQLTKSQTSMWHFAQDSSVIEHWDRVRILMKTVIEVMTTLTKHRLSHDLSSMFNIGNEWTNFKETASHQGFTTPFLDWQYLFHLKTAFAIKGNLITMAVEIPLIKKQQQSRKIFKLTQNPIHIKGKFYYASTQFQYVSVVNLVHGAMPMSIDTTHCANLNFLWFCTGSYVMPHHAPNTCAEAIWLGQEEDILNLCHLVATKEREFVVALNETTAIWYTSRAVTLVISCVDGRHATTQLNTTALVSVDRGCRVSTSNFTFSSADVAAEDGIRRVVNQQKNKEEGALDWGLTSWTLQRPEKIERRAAEIDEILRNAEPPLIPVWVAVLLAIIALVVVVIFILWLYLKARMYWGIHIPEATRVERKEEKDETELTQQ